MDAFDIATVGDKCIDRYLSPVGLTTVGGNAVNVAVHLRRLGRRVAYFGAVGNDASGRRLLACLRDNGLDTRHVRVAAGPTAHTDIRSDPAGERIIAFEDFGVCRGYRPNPDEVERLRSMRHVHLGWLDDGGALKRALVAAGVGVSQDVSVNAAPEDVDAAGLGIAFASAGASREAAERLLDRLLRAGARVAVVTCGSLGSMASDGRDRAETTTAPAKVIDTLGAGDTFIAAFLDARLGGRPLRACLEAGRDAAAETCAHFGGFPQPPLPLDRGLDGPDAPS